MHDARFEAVAKSDVERCGALQRSSSEKAGYPPATRRVGSSEIAPVVLRMYQQDTQCELPGVQARLQAGRAKRLSSWQARPDGRFFGDSFIRILWCKLHHEGLHRIVFYDGGVQSEADLLHLVAPERAWCYAFECAGEPLAFFWCNGFSGRAAHIHFCFFRAGMHRADELGKRAMRFLLGIEGRSEAPLDALLGVTPAPFAHAVRYAKRLGFRELGRIPGGLSLRAGALGAGASGRVVDAVLTLLARHDLESQK